MTCFSTQMNSQDVGALLVMDRAVLDADGDEIVTEAEFRASPQTGAMRGIVTERDYLRAVARGAVAADTKGERSQSPLHHQSPNYHPNTPRPITTDTDRPCVPIHQSLRHHDGLCRGRRRGADQRLPRHFGARGGEYLFYIRMGKLTEGVFWLQMEIMTERRIRHIPCIVPASKDGRTGSVMEGMVCIGDVVKALLAEEREEVQICRDFINGVYD